MQAFLEACYEPDNWPLRSPPDIVANVGTIVKQVKIRVNSKDLKNVPTPQQASSSSTMAGGVDHFMGIGCKLMSMLMDQAKALDALKSQQVNNDQNGLQLARSSSHQSLESPESNPSTIDLLNRKVLPVESKEPLPLPAPSAEHETEGTPEEIAEDKANDQKSLEDYEMEAHDMLTKRQARAIDAVMKRPASKAASQKATHVPKKKKSSSKDDDMPSKKLSPEFKKGIYGCLRCRGNVKGCSTCWEPSFQGQRFSSRSEWSSFVQKKSLKAKKSK